MGLVLTHRVPQLDRATAGAPSLAVHRCRTDVAAHRPDNRSGHHAPASPGVRVTADIPDHAAPGVPGQFPGPGTAPGAEHRTPPRPAPRVREWPDHVR